MKVGKKGVKKKGTASAPSKKAFGAKTAYAPAVNKVPLIGGGKKG